MAKKRILAIPRGNLFLERDINNILKDHFEIKTAPGFNYKKPLTIIPCIFGILRGTLWADLTFSWFADVHAMLAILFSKMFRKKSVVIVGGYEVAKVPEIGYGFMLNPVLSWVVKFVLKHADRVLTVADSLKEGAINNAKVNGKNIRTVPTCYDPDSWKPCESKENVVMTVAYGITTQKIKVKGLATFVKAAEYLPEVKFIVIGPLANNYTTKSKLAAPSNVEFLGFIPPEELSRWYSRAKVYCQLSRYEGLPNALCEAMLCECVPVGTKYGGIPVAIGDTGFYAPYGDVGKTVSAIKEALKSGKGKKARERIQKMFPLEKRRKELIGEIEQILGSKERQD